MRIAQGTFAKEHFDQDFNYFHEKDPVTKMVCLRSILQSFGGILFYRSLTINFK
jgi:hypothetical protein